MERVKINRLKLLKAVRKNRTEHVALHSLAMKAYRKESIVKLGQMLDDAKAGKEITHHTGLVEPRSHTEDYDRIIRMLEMSLEKSITLTSEEFSSYVMDNWGWKGQFLAVNSSYLSH